MCVPLSGANAHLRGLGHEACGDDDGINAVRRGHSNLGCNLGRHFQFVWGVSCAKSVDVRIYVDREGRWRGMCAIACQLISLYDLVLPSVGDVHEILWRGGKFRSAVVMCFTRPDEIAQITL